MSAGASEGRHILALNCGSSSLKFGLYAFNGKGAALRCEGIAEEVGGASSSFRFRFGANKTDEQISIPNHTSALDLLFAALKTNGLPQPDAVGHRFVHGGAKLREHR